MHPVLCINTHDFTDLVNHGMVKNTRTWLSQERILYETKKFLTYASDGTFWEVIV